MTPTTPDRTLTAAGPAASSALRTATPSVSVVIPTGAAQRAGFKTAEGNRIPGS